MDWLIIDILHESWYVSSIYMHSRINIILHWQKKFLLQKIIHINLENQDNATVFILFLLIIKHDDQSWDI